MPADVSRRRLFTLTTLAVAAFYAVLFPLAVTVMMDAYCQVCYGVGEFWFVVTEEHRHPPGTPPGVRIPCGECGGKGWQDSKEVPEHDAGRPD